MLKGSLDELDGMSFEGLYDILVAFNQLIDEDIEKIRNWSMEPVRNKFYQNWITFSIDLNNFDIPETIVLKTNKFWKKYWIEKAIAWKDFGLMIDDSWVDDIKKHLEKWNTVIVYNDYECDHLTSSIKVDIIKLGISKYIDFNDKDLIKDILRRI